MIRHRRGEWDWLGHLSTEGGGGSEYTELGHYWNIYSSFLIHVGMGPTREAIPVLMSPGVQKKENRMEPVISER